MNDVKGTKTYGEKAVGLDFNPSSDPAIHKAKSAFAEIIDQMAEGRNNTADPEKKRLYSVAITEAQSAQMWAVKALSWREFQ